MIKAKIAPQLSINTAEEWQKLNKEWEQTQEPQRQFCKKHNVPYEKFVYWRSKLLKTVVKPANKTAFQEIKVSHQHTTSTVKSQQIIKINAPGNILITIPVDIDEQALAILFKSLRRASHA